MLSIYILFNFIKFLFVAFFLKTVNTKDEFIFVVKKKIIQIKVLLRLPVFCYSFTYILPLTKKIFFYETDI